MSTFITSLYRDVTCAAAAALITAAATGRRIAGLVF